MKQNQRRGASWTGGPKAVRLLPGLDAWAGQIVGGRYRLETLIRSGLAGVVIAARHIRTREPVVLRMLASYTDGQDELLRKRITTAQIAAGLTGPHIARVLDIGVTEDAMPYVVSEAFEGTTLAAELESRGCLPLEEAVQWVREACEGLAEVHALGLVHGDLQPKNLFLADTARGVRVLKLVDVGTTSPFDAVGDHSVTPRLASAAYLAPEQIEHPESVDARTDVWALGVLLHHLLSGELPFSADTSSGVLIAVIYDTPELLSSAPFALASIVQRCLEKDPADRPQSVEALAAELAPFAGACADAVVEPAHVAVPPTLRAPVLQPATTLHDASASGAVPPVSLHVEPENVHRLARAPATMVGVLLAAAAIAIASLAATRDPAATTAPTASSFDDDAASTTTTTAAELDVPPFVPAFETVPPSAVRELLETEHPPSFAPSMLQPGTATPLVTTATPLAEPAPAGPPRLPAR